MAKKKSNTNSLIKTKGEWDKQDKRKKVATNGLIRTKAEWDELDKRWKEQQEEQKKQQSEKKTNLLDSVSKVNSARNKAEDYLKRQDQLKSAVKSTAAKDTREQKTYGRTTAASTTTKKQTVEPRSAVSDSVGKTNSRTGSVNLQSIARKDRTGRQTTYTQEKEKEEQSAVTKPIYNSARIEQERSESSAKIAEQIRESMRRNSNTVSRQTNTNIQTTGKPITGGVGRQTAGTTNLIDDILNRNRRNGSRLQPAKEVTGERGYAGEAVGRKKTNAAQDILGILNRNVETSTPREKSLMESQGAVGSGAGRKQINTQKIDQILGKSKLKREEKKTSLQGLGDAKTEAAGRRTGGGLNLDGILSRNNLNRTSETVKQPENTGFVVGGAGRRTGVNTMKIDQLLGKRAGTGANQQRDYLRPEYVSQAGSGAGRTKAGKTIDLSGMLNRNMNQGSSRDARYQTPETVTAKTGSAGRTGTDGALDLSGILNRNVSTRTERETKPEMTGAITGAAGRKSGGMNTNIQDILGKNDLGISYTPQAEPRYTQGETKGKQPESKTYSVGLNIPGVKRTEQEGQRSAAWGARKQMSDWLGSDPTATLKQNLQADNMKKKLMEALENEQLVYDLKNRDYKDIGKTQSAIQGAVDRGWYDYLVDELDDQGAKKVRMISTDALKKKKEEIEKELGQEAEYSPNELETAYRDVIESNAMSEGLGRIQREGIEYWDTTTGETTRLYSRPDDYFDAYGNYSDKALDYDRVLYETIHEGQTFDPDDEEQAEEVENLWEAMDRGNLARTQELAAAESKVDFSGSKKQVLQLINKELNDRAEVERLGQGAGSDAGFYADRVTANPIITDSREYMEATGSAADIAYYYINTPYQEQQKQLVKAFGYDENSLKNQSLTLYQEKEEYFLTPDEKDTFNGFYNAGYELEMQGRTEEAEQKYAQAMAFLNGLKSTGALQARRDEYQEDWIAEQASGPLGFLYTPANAVMSPIRGATGIVRSIASLFDQSAKDPTSAWFDLDQLNAVSSGKRAEQWGKALGNDAVGQWLYGAFSSWLNSTAGRYMGLGVAGGNMKAAEELSLITMASDAASNTMYNELRKGKGKTEAAILSLGAGLTEYFTEKVNFDKLFKVDEKALSKGWKGALKYIGVNAATEAGEEALGSSVETLLDVITSYAFDHKNELKEEYDKLVDSGMDSTKAGFTVLWNKIQDVGAEALAGAFGGALSSSLHAGYSNAVVNNWSRNMSKAAIKNENVGTMLEAAKGINGDADYKNKIASLDKAYQEKGGLSKAETFDLFKAIRLSNSRTAGGFARDEALDTVKALVMEKMEDKSNINMTQVNAATQAAADLLTTGEITPEQEAAMKAVPEVQDVVQDVVNERMSIRMIDDMANKPGQKTERAGQVELKLHNTGIASVADEQEENNAEGVRPKNKTATTVIAGGKWGEIKGISLSEHGTLQVETEDGQKTDVRDVRATNQAMAEVLHFAKTDMHDVDTKDGKTKTVFNQGSVEFVNKLLELAKTEKSSDLVNDALKVRLSTMLGLGTPKTELSNAATVAIKTQTMKEFDASEAARLSNPHAVRPGEGETYMNGQKFGTKEFTTMLKESGLSEEDQQYVKGIATVMRIAGVNTTIINDEKQAYQGFENKTGVTINIGAKLTETAEDGTKVKRTYNPFITVGHELTHVLEHASKEGYNALRKFVIETAAAKGINVMNEISSLITRTAINSEETVQLDYAGAIAEYVANSADQILLDKDLIQQMQERNPSLYKDMQGAVRKLIFRIKDAFKRLGGEGIQNDVWVNRQWSPDELKKIANLWGIAWEEAADRTAGKGVGIESVIEADEARKAAEKTAKESQQFAEDNNFSYAGKQFKIASPVEVRDDGMIAIHNMTMDRFKKSLAAGGMTWPSIAVASKDMKWENFGGDVSIYFGRDSVDPMKSENGMGTQRLYSGDAYTPMFRRDSGEYATMDAAEEFLKTQPERDYQTQDPAELLKDYRRVFDLEKARAQIQKQYGKDNDARVLTNKALKDKQYDALEAIRKDVKNHLLFSESTYNQMKTEDYVKRILFDIQDEIGVQRQQNPEAMTPKKIRQIISEKITDAAQTSRKDNGFVVKKGIKEILGEKAKNAAATIGKKTGFTVSQATADKIMDYITFAEEETGNEWLEAKLYRQAMYTEAAAIVLDKSETEAIAKLKDLGVDASRILTYDKNAPEGAADSKTEVRKNIPYLVEGTSFSINGAAESRANDRVYAENDIRYKLADPEVRSYLQTWANNHVRKNNEEREAILGRYGLEPEDMAEGVLKESAMTGYGISKKDMNRLRVLARDTDKWQNRAVEAMGLDEEDLGAQYVTAWKNYDRAKMESILMEKLSERTDVIPFKAAQWYDRGRSGRGTHQQIANLIKENNPEAITIAAVEMANLVPENAVLIPMPPHTGKVTEETDTMVLARKIAELTGRPVMNALEGAERESRRENKDKTLKNQMTAEDLGFRKTMEIPEGTIPYFIDNLVAAGTTAKAARDAFGGGITLAYAKSTRTAIPGLKNAGVTFTDGKQMNLIPLEDRFDMDQTGVTGTRYSYKAGESEEDRNIKKQIQNHLDEINQRDPVATINTKDIDIKKYYNEKTRKDWEAYKTWALDFIDSFGRKVERENFGEVIFTTKGIKRGFSYLFTPEQMAAFAAVPDVIKKGEEINYHENHKGREIESHTFAAPIIMDGKKVSLAVVVRNTRDQNRYKTHKVFFENGDVFTLEGNKIEAEEEKTLADEPRVRTSSASEGIVPQEQKGSNPNFDEASFSYNPGERDARESRLRQEYQAAGEELQSLREKYQSLKNGDEMKEWTKLIAAARDEEMDKLLKEYQAWESKEGGLAEIKAAYEKAQERAKAANKAFDDYIEERDVAKEKAEIEASGLEEPEFRRKQAVNEFGYTGDFREAGYMLPNGRMLNFTGEKGKHYGQRGEDHRGIGRIYASSEMQGGRAMTSFMNDGNIRVMAETPGIDISVKAEPTKEQYAAIRNMARRFANEGYFTVDFSDERGGNAGNLEYDGHVNPERVINDIRTYFRTGEVPAQSLASKYSYSYASGESQGDINYWMMTVDPNSLKTEAEKQLLQNYKSLRMKIDLNRMRQRDYAEKIAQLEKIKDPDRSTKNKIEGYKIRIENAKAAVKELESQLANITSNEGYARMMFQQNKIMEDFVMGRTQKDVEANISAMQRIAQSISERMAETQKKLEEMSNSAAVRNMRTFVDQKELDKWAAYFRKQYGSNMNKQELMDGLTGIALKLAAGRDITSDVEILAGQILAGVKGEDYTLSMLRGLTIRLGKGQIKELLGENSSLKELRKQLTGTGIKVEAAKDGQAGLDADWDELCDLIPSLNRDVTEKDQVGEILRLVQSARNEARQNMAEDQLSSVMAEIVANAMRISQGMPRDSETKTRISDMLDYIEEMAKEAGTAGADIRKLRDSISNMIEAGERAAGWTRAMRSDVQQAIDYFDKTAKMAIDSAKQQKTSEIVQQLKDKHAQKILEINEEWRELIERDRKARDLAEANESTRGIINTDARRLYKLLKEQTPQKNIPEHMQGIVRAMLRELLDNDMSEGRRKILRMNPKERAEMERLLTAWDIQNGKFDINTDIEDSEETPRMILWDDFNMIMEGLEAYSKPGNRKNKLDMLNDRQAALKKIQEAVSEIYGLVRSAQEIAIGDRRIAVEDQAYKVQGETGGKKFREWTGKFGRAIAALHKGIISGNMTPEYFFRGLKNAGLWDLWEGYHEAENRNGLELKRAKEKMASIAADHGYQNWDMNKRLTVQLEKGGSVQMTLGQLMSLYATWKREQAIGPAQSKHLEIGGFYVEEEDPRDGLLGRKATEKKAHRVTENDMALVQSLLTKEQMEYVDDVVDFMSHDLSKLGNEASMKAYGIKLYKEDYYFPFKMWDGIRSRKSNDAGSAAKNDRAFHPSFAKTRLHGANNALILGDFTETATDHIVGMINYATMGLANENLQKVLNAMVTEGEEKDNQTKRNIRTILEEAYGREAMQYLAKLQEQLNGGAAQGERSLGDKAITLFRKNAVAGSLSVAFQQPLSYIRAAMMMNPKYLAGAILKEYWKGSYKQLLKHSGIAVLKDMGRFDMGMAKVAKDYIAPEGKEGKIRTAWDKVTDYATILPEKMDAWTWTRMWVAVKTEQHEEHPEMDMDSDEFLDMCGERFNDIMRRTQVYDSTLVKSANMRSTNYWTKSLTSFMAEPTLTANMLMDAVRNVREKGGKLALARAGALYLLSAAAQAAIKAVFNSGRSPDEDKTWVENFLYRFAGNLINETDPFNLIPGYSDAVTLLKGGELNDDAMGAVGKIFQAGKNGVELIKEGFGKEPHRDLEDSVGQLTQLFTDMPLKNLMRDARAMYNWFVKKPYAERETNADVILHQTIDQAAKADNILGVINKWLGEAGYETSNKAYYKRIYEAKKAGNDSQAKSMIDYLLTGKGVNESTLNTGIKGFGKEDTSLSVDEKAKILSGTGKTDEDVWWELDRAAYKEETGRDAGSGKYYRLRDAIDSNKSTDIKNAVNLLVKHGVEKKNIKDKLSKDWKQPYLSAKGNEKVKIKNALIMAYKALGISETEANEIINKWK